MIIKEGDPRIAARKCRYHSLAEYLKVKRKFEKKHQPVKNGKFHKLAKKMEFLIPRGLRSASGLLTTELLLEIINEEKLELISSNKI